MSFELYDDMSFYNKFTFALQETEKRGFAVLASFSKLVSCIFSIIGFVSLMASVEYKLFIVVILCVVATFFLNKHIAKAQHMFDLESVQSKREARYIGRVNYLREYAQDLKLHGFSALEELYIKANDKLIGLINLFGRRIATLTFIQNAINALVSTVSMIYLAVRAFYREILISDYVMLNSCAIQLYSQMSNLLNVFNEFYEHSLYIGNFREFLNNDELLQKYGNYEVPNEEISIKFENVAYKYPNSPIDSVYNVCLAIKGDEKIAVIGNNGAGKSTLLKLLARIYDPSCGKILINGRDCREYSRSSFYQTVSFQLQDFKLYSISIAENILMREIVNSDDENRVVDALKFVGLYDKVFCLPDNIYSVFTSEFSGRGVYFSSGEMQKLSLARAYASDGRILLFDEPTNSLDAIAESQYIKQLMELKGKTILVVTHSITNAKCFDRIILMDKGVIIGCGTHEELLVSSEMYQKMLAAQNIM